LPAISRFRNSTSGIVSDYRLFLQIDLIPA